MQDWESHPKTRFAARKILILCWKMLAEDRNDRPPADEVNQEIQALELMDATSPRGCECQKKAPTPAQKLYEECRRGRAKKLQHLVEKLEYSQPSPGVVGAFHKAAACGRNSVVLSEPS